MSTTYVLTAEMDDDSFGWLDALRRANFPPERNVLPAHLTLFHKLAPDQIDRLRLLELPSAPLQLRFDAVTFLGAGVAIRIQSDGLERLRADAKTVMGGELSRQDKQRWRPHVTVQNKVPAEIARQLHQRLTSDFVTRAGTANGLLIWEYLGGPWKDAGRIALGNR